MFWKKTKSPSQKLIEIVRNIVRQAPHTDTETLRRNRITISWTNNASQIEQLRNALKDYDSDTTVDPKTFQDIVNLIPGSETGKDNNGQLVIYTGYQTDKNGTLEPYDPDA